jgi:hypothetical protein
LPPPAEAERVARELLADDPKRLRHDVAVGENARRVVARLRTTAATADLAVAAAFLHDVGYAEALKQTGFHPIDGARYLRERGWEPIARIVAHHSQAFLQARQKGLSLADFPPHRGLAQDAVDYCDVRTGPDGSTVSARERLDEIVRRHGPDSIQGREMGRRRPLVERLVRRVETRCGGDPLARGRP